MTVIYRTNENTFFVNSLSALESLKLISEKQSLTDRLEAENIPFDEETVYLACLASKCLSDGKENAFKDGFEAMTKLSKVQLCEIGDVFEKLQKGETSFIEDERNTVSGFAEKIVSSDDTVMKRREKSFFPDEADVQSISDAIERAVLCRGNIFKGGFYV